MSSLTPQQLVRAYCHGFFPMAEHRHGPIHWFCPEQRGLLPLDRFHIPRRLQRRVRQAPFTLSMNAAFADVVRACAAPRATSEETWINDQIIAVYTELHRAGLAHSLEAWTREAAESGVAPRLVGGIYGVALGGAFFGESMFSRATDASKICLVHLVRHLQARRFALFDVQFVNPHLEQFGVESVPRDDYLRALAAAVPMKVRW